MFNVCNPQEEGLPPLCYNPRHAITFARTINAFVDVPDEEWLIAVFLNGTSTAICGHLMYRGHACPCAHLADLEAMVAAGRACGATGVVTLRYHPHPWSPLIINDPAFFQSFFCTIKRGGIHLRDHLTMGSSGLVHQFRPQCRPLHHRRADRP